MTPEVLRIYNRLDALLTRARPQVRAVYSNESIGLNQPEVVAQLPAAGPGDQAVVVHQPLSYAPIRPASLAFHLRGSGVLDELHLVAGDDGQGNVRSMVYEHGGDLTGTVNYLTGELHLLWTGRVGVLLVATYSYDMGA